MARGRYGSGMRRIVPRIVALLAALLVLAPNAFALNPEQTLTGLTGSQWYSGDWSFQDGQNCVILGQPKVETMTTAVGSYGGTSGLVRVGDRYWASLLVSTPGNPCPYGSAGVQTDLFLPPGTSIDTTRPVRCFVKPRNVDDVVNGWYEATNETWSFPQLKMSGNVCTNGSVGPSTLAGGGYNIGYRLIPNGLMLKIFVPVISSQLLAGANGQVFDWLVGSSAAFSTPGLTRTSAFVFSAAANQTGPQFFFNRDATPFWDATKPLASANRAEFWMNAWVDNKPGYLSWEIRRTDSNAVVFNSAMAGAGWNGTVPAGFGMIQLGVDPTDAGPQGGYVPTSFAQSLWNVPMRITWTFTPNPGYGSAVTGSQTFRTLPGPDGDGDGVADSADGCPAVVGHTANGCPPSDTTSDGDGDGVKGAADACPSTAAPGTADGCPAPAPTATPVPGSGGGATTVLPQSQGGAPAPQGRLLAKPKSTISKAKLVAKSGATLTVQCTAGASVTVGLVATKSAAKLLKLKTNPLPTLATAKGVCASGDTRLKLAASKPLAAKLKRTRAQLSATLTATVKNDAGAATAPPVGVKIK